MSFKNSGEVRYFSFNSFKHVNISHAIFTRHGGCSPKPWKSLNVGSTVGDNRVRVIRNQRLALEAIGCEPKSLYDVWQVHGSNVVCVDNPRDPDVPHIKADAMVTDKPDVTLFMRFADCVPILLCDPDVQVVGLVHAGWQGTVDKVATKTIKRMTEIYGCRPQNILAGIGPSICVDHYSVGSEVEDKVRDSFQNDSDRLLQRDRGEVKFDLWAANRLLLSQAGLLEIELANICTACQNDDWYSHRREGGKTGRFGALIML